ncbi:hypothetical protein Tco_0615848 [Tanacetum coccineum]
MTRTVKVKGSVLDVKTQIILFLYVQNHRETRTKEHSLEALEAIAVEEYDEKVNEKHLPRGSMTHPNEICLRVDLEPDEWVEDSGCTKHMTGNRKLFSTYKAYNGVPQPRNMTIGTVWVFGNKLDENGIVSRNKASSTCQDMCDEFAKIRHDEFEMSMMGALNFFLGLQIKKMKDDTTLTKDEECESVDNTKYQGMIEAPKTSHLEEVKRIFRYLKGTTHLGLWYPKGTSTETVVYADSDHTRDYVDRKSTSSICTFVGCCLTSWFLKKQTALAISTTEAEYISVGKACQQALWMKQALNDYDIRLDDVSNSCGPNSDD